MKVGGGAGASEIQRRKVWTTMPCWRAKAVAEVPELRHSATRRWRMARGVWAAMGDSWWR